MTETNSLNANQNFRLSSHLRPARPTVRKSGTY
ncbi:Uncharacterised protein [Vibrio cholerae]|nr:Uncharacterised protein [Vibrio cholerae]